MLRINSIIVSCLPSLVCLSSFYFPRHTVLSRSVLDSFVISSTPLTSLKVQGQTVIPKKNINKNILFNIQLLYNSEVIRRDVQINSSISDIRKNFKHIAMRRSFRRSENLFFYCTELEFCISSFKGSLMTFGQLTYFDTPAILL